MNSLSKIILVQLSIKKSGKEFLCHTDFKNPISLCKVTKFYPDEKYFNIFKAKNEIFRYIKESIKKSTEKSTKNSLID